MLSSTPRYAGFRENIEKLGAITGENIGTFKGYLNALRNRREFFRSMGATATDHGHLTAMTADLDPDRRPSRSTSASSPAGSCCGGAAALPGPEKCSPRWQACLLKTA